MSQEETSGKEKGILLKMTYEEVGAFEKQVEELKNEENSRLFAKETISQWACLQSSLECNIVSFREQMLWKLGSQRDRMTRLLSSNEFKLKETLDKVQLKDLEIADLKNVRTETQKRGKDFQQLYDLVKNQRNKFVNLIQARCTLLALSRSLRK